MVQKILSSKNLHHYRTITIESFAQSKYKASIQCEAQGHYLHNLSQVTPKMEYHHQNHYSQELVPLVMVQTVKLIVVVRPPYFVPG